MLPVVTFTSDTSGTSGFVLSGDPFQRAGAWVFAVLAGVDNPNELSWSQVDDVWDRLCQYFVDTSMVTSGKVDDGEPLAWFRRAAQNHFPQSSIEANNRLKWEPVERERRVLAQLNERQDFGVPCNLCGEAAVAGVNKVTWPLQFSSKFLVGPSALHDYPAVVCEWCRRCGWAVPFGVATFRASSYLFLSDDVSVERDIAREVVMGNVQALDARVAEKSSGGDVDGAEVALTVLRRSRVPHQAGDVRLLVYKSPNQPADATAKIFCLGDADARWVAAADTEDVRLLADSASRFDKDGVLSESGYQRLANVLFGRDSRFGSVGGMVKSAVKFDPERWGGLVGVYTRYLSEVSKVENVETVERVAEKVVRYVCTKDYSSLREEFRRAAQDGPGTLKRWFRKVQWDWLKVCADADGPLLTAAEWLVLFPEDGGWDERNLFEVHVVEKLHARDNGKQPTCVSVPSGANETYE